MPRPDTPSGGAFIMDQAIETTKHRKQQSNKFKDAQHTKVAEVARGVKYGVDVAIVNTANSSGPLDVEKPAEKVGTTADSKSDNAIEHTVIDGLLSRHGYLNEHAEITSNLLYAEPQRGSDGRWKKLTEAEQQERAARIMGVANEGVTGGVAELDSEEEEAAFEYDQDMIDLQEELNAKRGPVNAPDEDLGRPNGRVHGRQLVKWNIHADQTLLLCIQYECYKNHVKIPWKKVALRMAAEKKPSAQCVIQHLSKVRLHMLDTGRWVPPLMGRTNQQYMASNTDGRGMVKCIDPETQKVTFRDVDWDENLDDLVGPPSTDPRILPTRSIGGRKRYESADYNPAPTLTRSTVVANPTTTLTGAGKRWNLDAPPDKKPKKNNGVKRAYRKKPKKTEADDLIKDAKEKVMISDNDDQGGFVRRSKRARRSSVEYQESVAGSDSDVSMFVAEEGSIISPEDRLAIRNTVEEIRREDDLARMMAAATESPAIPAKPKRRRKSKVNKKVVVLKTGNIAHRITNGAPDDVSRVMVEDTTPVNQPLLFEDMLGDPGFIEFVDHEIGETIEPVSGQLDRNDAMNQYQKTVPFSLQQTNPHESEPQGRPAWVFEDVNGQAFCYDRHGYVAVYNPATNEIGPYDNDAYFHKQTSNGRIEFYHEYGREVRGRQPGGVLATYSNLVLPTPVLPELHASGSKANFRQNTMNNEDVSEVFLDHPYNHPSDMSANTFEGFGIEPLGIEPLQSNTAFHSDGFAFDYNFTLTNNNTAFDDSNIAFRRNIAYDANVAFANDVIDHNVGGVVYQGQGLYAQDPLRNQLSAINSGIHTVDPTLESLPWVNGEVVPAHQPTNDNMEGITQLNVEVDDSDVDVFADIDFSGLD